MNQSRLRDRRSSRCSARALARSSRNDIVAVKFELDEKRRARIAVEFDVVQRLMHALQIRLKCVIGVRLCRLRIPAADRKRTSRSISHLSDRLVALRKEEVEAPARQPSMSDFSADDPIFM